MVCIYEGVGIMTLGLTKIEYSRLQKRMIISEKQRRNNPQEIPSFTEMEIVAAIQSGMSSPEIRLTFGVCNQTVLKIRRKHSLWGI